MTALMLLAPGTPMLFQGQEFAASSPFLYFADHRQEVAQHVKKGRIEFLRQFASMSAPAMKDALADPTALDAFERSKLDFSERERHPEAYALHRDLLRLRRQDPVFNAQKRRGVDGAVLGPESFVLRYCEDHGDDRLLIVNLGRDMHLVPLPEPLLAPPRDKVWECIWSSEDPLYGGNGIVPPDTEADWHISAESAVVLAPKAAQR